MFIIYVYIVLRKTAEFVLAMNFLTSVTRPTVCICVCVCVCVYIYIYIYIKRNYKYTQIHNYFTFVSYIPTFLAIYTVQTDASGVSSTTAYKFH